MLISLLKMVNIVRLTVTAREGGLEAQAKLDVVVKDVNDNEPKFEVIISLLVVSMSINSASGG